MCESEESELTLSTECEYRLNYVRKEWSESFSYTSWCEWDSRVLWALNKEKLHLFQFSLNTFCSTSSTLKKDGWKVALPDVAVCCRHFFGHLSPRLCEILNFLCVFEAVDIEIFRLSLPP